MAPTLHSLQELPEVVETAVDLTEEEEAEGDGEGEESSGEGEGGAGSSFSDGEELGGGLADRLALLQQRVGSSGLVDSSGLALDGPGAVQQQQQQQQWSAAEVDAAVAAPAPASKAREKGKGKSKVAAARSAAACALCSRAATRTWAPCPACGTRTHVECLARSFLEVRLQNRGGGGWGQLGEHWTRAWTAWKESGQLCTALPGPCCRRHITAGLAWGMALCHVRFAASALGCLQGLVVRCPHYIPIRNCWHPVHVPPLQGEGAGATLPTRGRCPSCSQPLVWMEVLSSLQNAGWDNKKRGTKGGSKAAAGGEGGEAAPSSPAAAKKKGGRGRKKAVPKAEAEPGATLADLPDGEAALAPPAGAAPAAAAGGRQRRKKAAAAAVGVQDAAGAGASSSLLAERASAAGEAGEATEQVPKLRGWPRKAASPPSLLPGAATAAGMGQQRRQQQGGSAAAAAGAQLQPARQLWGGAAAAKAEPLEVLEAAPWDDFDDGPAAAPYDLHTDPAGCSPAAPVAHRLSPSPLQLSAARWAEQQVQQAASPCVVLLTDSDSDSGLDAGLVPLAQRLEQLQRRYLPAGTQPAAQRSGPPAGGPAVGPSLAGMQQPHLGRGSPDSNSCEASPAGEVPAGAQWDSPPTHRLSSFQLASASASPAGGATARASPPQQRQQQQPSPMQLDGAAASPAGERLGPSSQGQQQGQQGPAGAPEVVDLVSPSPLPLRDRLLQQAVQPAAAGAGRALFARPPDCGAPDGLVQQPGGAGGSAGGAPAGTASAAGGSKPKRLRWVMMTSCLDEPRCVKMRALAHSLASWYAPAAWLASRADGERFAAAQGACTRAAGPAAPRPSSAPGCRPPSARQESRPGLSPRHAQPRPPAQARAAGARRRQRARPPGRLCRHRAALAVAAGWRRGRAGGGGGRGWRAGCCGRRGRCHCDRLNSVTDRESEETFKLRTESAKTSTDRET